jgi:hypothetical protein
VLIVGLNSDTSVRGKKGPHRPIVPERKRAEMLLALRMVDYVHIFDEGDPRVLRNRSRRAREWCGVRRRLRRARCRHAWRRPPPHRRARTGLQRRT